MGAKSDQRWPNEDERGPFVGMCKRTWHGAVRELTVPVPFRPWKDCKSATAPLSLAPKQYVLALTSHMFMLFTENNYAKWVW